MGGPDAEGKLWLEDKDGNARAWVRAERLAEADARLAVEAKRIKEMQRCREKLGRERDEFEERLAAADDGNELLMEAIDALCNRIASLEAENAAYKAAIERVRAAVEARK